MIYLIYFLVVIVASVVGSISGMGGGVITKPIFELIGAHSIIMITIFSSISVFVMSLVSVLKRLRNGVQVNWGKMVMLMIASSFGGYLGHILFEHIAHFISERSLQLLQIIMTLLLLSVSFAISHKPVKHRYQSRLIYCGVGLFLGFFSSFLGIGGGPINVAALLFLFSLSVKDATFASLLIIFFSQLSHLLSLFIFQGIPSIDIILVLMLILASVLGATLGSYVVKLVSNETMMRIYSLVMGLVIIINLVNALKLILFL